MITLRTMLQGFFLILLAATLRVGYSSFFDTEGPAITHTGIAYGGTYAGTIPCTVMSSKKGRITVCLDGKEIVDDYRRALTPLSFELATQSVADGSHLLSLHCVDDNYYKNQAVQEIPFVVDNTPLELTLIKEQECKVLQGRTLHVQFKTNKAITDGVVRAFSNSYPCVAEGKRAGLYECFIPIECEELPAAYPLTISVTDAVGNQVKQEIAFEVLPCSFEKGTVTITAEKLHEEDGSGFDTKRFNLEVEKITRNSPAKKLWQGTFCTPIDIQRITTPFGTVRTTQHKGRYAHKALDIVNQPKSVVWAPQDGVIVMKDRFAESGNTVIIDHGFGVITMLFHLDSFAHIKVGEKITKGSPVGTIGKTGYAAGYHLHWEMRVNNIPIDPMQWTQVTF